MFAKYLATEIPIKPHMRILDFGGGRGDLGMNLARLMRDGGANTVDVTLVDLNTASWPDEQGITFCWFSDLGELEDVFDVVIASVILEHIPALHPIVQLLLDRIAPGGLFYARTPYRLPLQRLLGGLSMYFPMHVHDLGPSFWNRVPDRYRVALEIVASRPAIVEARLSGRHVEAVIATLLKLPARIERWARRNPKDFMWNLVGGWEVLFRRQHNGQ